MEIEPEVVACMNDMLDIVVRKEEKRLYHIQYYQKTKEKKKQKSKDYYQENKEEIIQKQKQYRQTTEKGIKVNRIGQWKYSGVICDDFDALYHHYIKTSYCDFCRVELTYDKRNTATTKCLDHDHSITDRPNFRNILCNFCNIKRR